MTARLESLPAGGSMPVRQRRIAPRLARLKRDGVTDFLDGLLEQYEQSARTLRAQPGSASAETSWPHQLLS